MKAVSTTFVYAPMGKEVLIPGIMKAVSTVLAVLGALHLSAQFAAPVNLFYSDVDYPYLVSTGDVDGDGHTDILYAQNNGCYVFLNDGNGGFGPRISIPVGGLVLNSMLGLADVNGDGIEDILFGGAWYPGLGGGAFGPGQFVSNGRAMKMVADMDGDGDLDMLVGSVTAAQLWINDGTGNFTDGQAIGTTGTTTSMYPHLKDVSGDGLPDLVIGGGCTQRGWYQNLGGGNFGPVNAGALFASSGVTHCGDVDGDGDNDILTKNGTITIWLANDGTGNFTVADTLTEGPFSSPGDVAGDVDGDGDLDLAVETGSSCDVRWWWNTGNGYSWNDASVETLGAYSLKHTRYALGDIDGDGALDLVATNGQGILMWYRNEGGSWGPRHNVGAFLGGGNDLSVADIDQDGDPDLVASALYGRHITWYPNNGDGTFGTQRVVAENLGDNYQAHAIDLNGDGFPDVLSSKPEAAIIWNIGGGNGWVADSLPGQGISRCEADLDGDLDPDLVGVNAWYENDGTGHFTRHAEPLLIEGKVQVADMNADGIPDIVIGGGGWRVLLNDGSMGLSMLEGAGNMDVYDLADVDGDGAADAYAEDYGRKVYLMRNDGTGLLTPSLQASIGGNGTPRHMLATDINGDGFPDAVWAMSDLYTHNTYYNLNLGNGELGPTGVVVLGNGSAGDMLLADLNADVVPDLASVAHNQITWQQNHFYDAFRLRGHLYYDFDVDATMDSLEHPVRYKLVSTDANEVLVWSNSTGEFDLPADTGTWHVWHTPPPSYQVTNDPDTLVATLTPQAPIATGLDIGLAPATNDTALGFWVTYQAMRCNTAQVVQLRLANNGTAIATGVVLSFELLGDLTYSSVSPAPDSIVGPTFFWNLDSLHWFQEFVAQITVDVGAAGTTAGWHATMVAANLPDTLVAGFGPQGVSCSWDPNDKLVTPQGYGSAGAVPVDIPWLDYTVRFQNTGTDTAFNVSVLDTLDTDLDPLTMEVLDASHPLTRIEVDTGRVALFQFQHILLPDSGANETASHGFVRFRIRPVAGSPDGTQITNSAGIVFDWNAPVITNTVLNTLVDCSLYQALITDQGSFLEASAGESYQWFLNGDTVPGGTGATITDLHTGSYTVQVTSVYGCVSLSDPVEVITTGITGAAVDGVRIFPNPAHNRLVIASSHGWTSGTHLRILDASGRVLRDQALVGLAAGGAVELNVADLAAGSYVLQLFGAKHVEILRFSKD